MTPGRARRRGEPLVVLGTIMLCWIGVRTAIWWAEHPDIAIAPPVEEALAETRQPGLAWPAQAFERPAAVPRAPLPPRTSPAIAAPSLRAPSGTRQAWLPGAAGSADGLALPRPSAADEAPVPAAPRAATDLPVPSLALGKAERPSPRRWSADAWVLVRGGGGVSSAGLSVATYGGSQTGAVLRYRLMPGDPHRLTAYLRASAALNGSGEREAALGLSVRPVGALPVVVAAEGRVGRLSGRTVVRPAVMAVTELAPVSLSAKARAEAYLQGGYVGGFGATPFIDGQLRVDRELARIGPLDLRAGGGVWGGAQRGAGRLDAGPSATLSLARGPAAARATLDWRFRIEGGAQPASGPALTISAGF